MSLQRRTQLRSRAPIARKTPLPRPGWSRKPPGAHRKPRTVRDTGFSPAVKLAVRTRAGGGDPHEAACEACGIHLGLHGGQIQHRRARGRGGSRAPVTNSPANGALMCGTPQTGCHGLAEARDKHMYGAGWWLASWQDPAAEPVMLHGADGGQMVYLGADGRYWLSPPERDAA